MYSFSRSAGTSLRDRFWPNRKRPPLYEGTLLDDLLFGRPINGILRVVRFVGRHRRVRSRGTSVIIVNYNTRHLLESVLQAVEYFSPDDTELIVVDNDSSDGSREWLRGRPFGCRPVFLPFNIHHGRALDVCIALSRSPIVVTLDSDAFPYSKEWLPILETPIREQGMWASGMWGKRDRLHPACAAFRRDRLFETKMSFAGFWLDDVPQDSRVWGRDMWDVGELLFHRLGAENVQLFPVRPTTLRGVEMEECVFHLEGGTTVDAWYGGDKDGSFEAKWSLAVNELLNYGSPESAGESLRG